jgi:hypothetical protein
MYAMNQTLTMSSLPVADYQPADKDTIGDNRQCDHDMKNKKDDSSSGKDRNTNTDGRINLRQKFRANKFLRVHLHVLKALYEQETPMQPITGGRHVEKKYWDAVEKFLKERNSIKRSTERTQRMRRIHDEAKEFQKMIPSFSIASDHIISQQVSPQLKRLRNHNSDRKGPLSNLAFGSSALMLITQPSPRYLPGRPPSGWNGGGCKTGGDMQSDTIEDDGSNAFGIVSGLLRRKHNLASRRLNQRTSKLRALVEESRRRIEILKSELIAEKQNESTIRGSGKSIETFETRMEACEDRQIRIETKIRLWKLLLHDLLATISA